MIAKLTGIVDSLGETSAVVDVGGVGYLVACSGRTLGRMATGEAVSLLVETHVREDAILLYGFHDGAERDWFRLLTQVQGVGAKVALSLLSALTPDHLTRAIASGDRTALTRAAGVGPKLAARILSELKDKVAGLTLGVAARVPMPAAGRPGMAEPNPAADAVSALVNLGYNPSEALGAVSQASGRLGMEAGVDALIRAGLAELMPRESGR